MIRVCACESQPIVIEGLRRTLEDSDGLEFGGSVNELGPVLEFASERRPKVCLIDKSFGTKAVFQVISDLKVDSPAVEAVLWTAEISEVESFRALQVGARGILMKSLPVATILDCIQTVAKGNIWIENSVSDQFVGFINRRSTPRLTPREEEILSLVMRGMKNKQIAEELSITTGTVKVHLMSNDQRLPFQPIEADIRRVRNSSSCGTIDRGTFNALQDAAFKPVADLGEPPRFSGQVLSSQCRRLAESDDAGHILRTRTVASFMAPAMLYLLELGPLPHIERAGALWPIELVGAQAKQINAKLFHFGRNFPRALHAIGVKNDTGFAGDFRNLGDRLHGSQFVVSVHNRNQLCVWLQGSPHVVRGDDSLGADPDIRNFDPLFLKLLASVQDRGVLNRARDDMVARTVRGADRPQNGQVVRFGATARKDDFGRCAVQERDDLAACALDTRLGILPKAVNARRVAVRSIQAQDNRVPHLGCDRCRGVVVKVVALHTSRLASLIISCAPASSPSRRTSVFPTTTSA